jgi:hypothetical protein
MAVTFDANATAVTTGSSVTTISSSNLTIGSGNCLVVSFITSPSIALPPFTSITWGSQNLNLTPNVLQAAPGASSGIVGMWIFLNPVSGTQTLTFNWTGTRFVDIYSSSYNGVGGFSTSSASGTSAAPSYSITSGAGHFAVDAVQGGNTSVIGSGVGQTQLALDNSLIAMGQSYISNQPTASFSWTLSPSTNWSAVLADLVPVSMTAGLATGEAVVQSFRTLSY